MKHKKILNTLILLLTAALVLGCEESTGPEDGSNDKPPGYQEDIPWPSLADSPWPMYRADPQNTGRSKYIGPKMGEIKWMNDSLSPASAVTIDQIGNQYVVLYNNYPNQENYGLVRLNEDGRSKYFYEYESIDFGTVSPVVTSNSTIYIAENRNGFMSSIDTNGYLKWSLDNIRIFQTGINIDKNGTIYAISGSEGGIFYLNAISSTGDLLWKLKGDFGGVEGYGMSLSPDSKTLYIPGHPNFGKKLYAVDLENRSIKWSFGERRVQMTADIPLVDSNGNIYIISKQEETDDAVLLSMNDKGLIRWKHKLKNNPTPFGPFCMDKFGNIYLGEYKLISVDYEGNLRWELPLENVISTPIIIDKSGTIYFGIGVRENSKICAVNSEGALLWNLNVENLFDYSSNWSPSLNNSGELIMSTLRNYKIAAIK